VHFSKAGYIDLFESILVSGEEELTFDFQLEAGAKIIFDKPLPSSVGITALRDGDVRNFSHNEPMALPTGSWEISFDGPISNDATVTVSVADADVQLSMDQFLADMTLKLRNLRPESSILDPQSRTAIPLSGDSLMLPYYETELLVTTPHYKDVFLTVSPDYTKAAYDVMVDYQLSDHFRSQRRIAWGLGFLISGVVVAGTSVVLNVDPVSIALTASYDGYAALKNVTFNLFLVGGASTVGGLITTLSGIRLRNSPDDPIITVYNFAQSRSGR